MTFLHFGPNWATIWANFFANLLLTVNRFKTSAIFCILGQIGQLFDEYLGILIIFWGYFMFRAIFLFVAQRFKSSDSFYFGPN